MAFWSHWEGHLRKLLEDPYLMNKIRENSYLKGYEDATGKITYAKIANRKSFGVFNDIVTDLFPRDRIAEVPSMVHKLLHRVAKTYPKYIVQYADLEIGSQESYLPSISIDSPGIYDLLDWMDNNESDEPVIGICVLDNTGANMFHGTAFVAWKKDDIYHYAYYDPLAYRKARVRKTGSPYYQEYAYAETVFKEKYFSTVNIRFHNLAEFCFQKGKEFHCPQYIIDGEYCFIYSLFFLFKWVQHKDFKKAVQESYIVEPSLLTRANTKESMTYRVVLMSFLLTMIMKYAKSMGKTQLRNVFGETYAEKLEDLLIFHEGFYESFGIPLMLSSKSLKSF